MQGLLRGDDAKWRVDCEDGLLMSLQEREGKEGWDGGGREGGRGEREGGRKGGREGGKGRREGNEREGGRREGGGRGREGGREGDQKKGYSGSGRTRFGSVIHTALAVHMQSHTWRDL